jgi:hypothetical protein
MHRAGRAAGIIADRIRNALVGRAEPYGVKKECARVLTGTHEYSPAARVLLVDENERYAEQ